MSTRYVSAKSVKYLLAREVLTLLILITTAMSCLFVFWQSRIDDATQADRTRHFAEQIERDQDTLLLHIILKRATDLNAYFDNLKHLFPDVPFCIDLNPNVTGLDFSCGPPQWVPARTVSIYENRNHLIHIQSPVLTSYARIRRAFYSPYLWLSAVTAALIALFLRLRLAGLLTRPINRIRERLELLAVGNRQVSRDESFGILEWDQIETSVDQLVEYLRDAEREQNDLGRDQLAQQIAHDIRSPMSALRIACQVLTEISADKRAIIEGAVNRIEEVADDLASQSRSRERQAVSQVLRSLVDEKRLEYADRSIVLDFQNHLPDQTVQIDVPLSVLKRVLSNLINNAVEASGDAGRVCLELRSDAKNLIFKIMDSGKGLAQADFRRLRNGETFGKANGQGLGLKLARRMAREWNGSLTIQSAAGLGTIIQMSLPTAIDRHSPTVHLRFGVPALEL